MSKRDTKLAVRTEIARDKSDITLKAPNTKRRGDKFTRFLKFSNNLYLLCCEGVRFKIPSAVFISYLTKRYPITKKLNRQPTKANPTLILFGFMNLDIAEAFALRI